MDTKLSNSHADLNVCLAADDIIELFESLGFTSDVPPDVELLRHSIVEAIQNRTMPKPPEPYTHDELVTKFEAFFK